jgi:antitoxin CptB
LISRRWPRRQRREEQSWRAHEEKQTVDEQYNKLHWRCRRGMKELDLLALGYLERYYRDASAEDQEAFARLLELQDPQLMGYMLGRETSADAAEVRVIGVMRSLLNP